MTDSIYRFRITNGSFALYEDYFFSWWLSFQMLVSCVVSIMSINYPSFMQVISFSKHFSLDRKGYYKVLEEAGKQGLNITGWLTWFLQTTIAAMQEAYWIVDQVVMKAQFWQLHHHTSLNPRQVKGVNRLLDAGEKFEGGMTTRKYASMAKCSKVTASRGLTDLLNKKILQKTAAGGRSTSCEIRIAPPKQ